MGDCFGVAMMCEEFYFFNVAQTLLWCFEWSWQLQVASGLLLRGILSVFKHVATKLLGCSEYL